MKMRISRTSVNSNAVNSEQVFVKGDEGGNSCVQGNGYMIGVSGKQVVLPHQSEGKVTGIFSYGQSDCPSFQIGSDEFYPVHGFLKNMWSDPQDILPSLPCPSCLAHQSLPQDVKGDFVVNEIAYNANHSFRLQPIKEVSALKVEGIAPVAMSDDEGRIQVNDRFKGVMEVSPFCHFASTPSPAKVPQANQGLCQDNQPTPPEPLSTVASSPPLAGKSNLFVSALPEFLVANLQAFSASLPSFAPPAKKHSTLCHLGWHIDCDAVNSEQVERCVPVNDGFKGFVEVSSLAQASSTPFHGKVLQANRVRSQPYLLTAHLLPSTAVSSLPLAGRSNLFVSTLPEFLAANLQAFSASLPSFAPPAKKHNADVKAMKEVN
jgi:hypothetical protein